MSTDIRGHEALLHHQFRRLCESRGGRPGLTAVPNRPYGLCGRKATLNSTCDHHNHGWVTGVNCQVLRPPRDFSGVTSLLLFFIFFPFLNRPPPPPPRPFLCVFVFCFVFLFVCLCFVLFCLFLFCSSSPFFIFLFFIFLLTNTTTNQLKNVCPFKKFSFVLYIVIYTDIKYNYINLKISLCYDSCIHFSEEICFLILKFYFFTFLFLFLFFVRTAFIGWRSEWVKIPPRNLCRWKTYSLVYLHST